MIQGKDTMSCIVADISQEVQEIFQHLTGDASVCLADVEKRVSAAVNENVSYSYEMRFEGVVGIDFFETSLCGVCESKRQIQTL